MNHLVFTQDDAEYRRWIANNFAAVETQYEGDRTMITLTTHKGDRPQVGYAELCYQAALPYSPVKRPFQAHWAPYTNLHTGLDVAMLNLSEFLEGPPCPFHPLKVDEAATLRQIADYFRSAMPYAYPNEAAAAGPAG